MRNWLLLLLPVISFAANGQFRRTPPSFIRHLLNEKFYDEAILVLNEKLQYASSQPELDSLNFMLGKTYYIQKKLSESIRHLDLVSEKNATLGSEARFFSAFNEAYLRNFDMALKKFRKLQPIGEDQKQLRIFELAGVSLLQIDLSRFDSLRKEFSSTWYPGIEQKNNFAAYKGFLRQMDNKKPVVAGLLSAVIPGAGKYYAGRKGNGIFTFLISALLGLQTYEAYKKVGPSSVRFIIYGSLFSVFYVANIWGSVLAVKIVRNETKDAIQNQILLDMHIPLRALFQ
jgi:tetratricopeptide (TPR) repeat protein